MSWQGNNCLVQCVRGMDTDFSQMIENTRAMLDMYDTHGRGWYLLGCFDDETDDDDWGAFNPNEEAYGTHVCYCQMPNPFIGEQVAVIRLRRAEDAVWAAYELWDSNFDAIAYAGDGDEPLERVPVYGKVYDMRARRMA